ncbi:DUF485 domain-containing protein [Chloroflexota bacterium]
MGHGPATKWKEDISESFKTKLGLSMFAIFAPVYLAFILVCVLSPQIMGRDVGSLNVAIVFGFGIIILAIVQALIYNFICSRREKADEKAGSAKEKAD